MDRYAAALSILTVLAAGAASAEATDAPTIAVLPFEATPGGRLLPPPQLGVIAGQLMVDQLVSSNRYRVLDGRWLQPRGQHLSPQALASHATHAGVDYLVQGEITRFSTERRGRSLGGFGLRLPFVGAYNRRTTTTAVSVLVSVIDVRTGEIRATTIGEGASHRTLRRLGGILVPGGGGGSSDATGFDDALLDEATREAIVNASRGVVNAAARLQVHGEHAAAGGEDVDASPGSERSGELQFNANTNR